MPLLQYGILDMRATNTGSCPAEWGRDSMIDKDLNDGCEGKTIPLCVKRGWGTQGIKAIKIQVIKNGQVLNGTECPNKDPQDLKEGSVAFERDGYRMYLCRTYGDVFWSNADVIDATSSSPAIADDWRNNDQDLEAGCRNDHYKYLIYKESTVEDVCSNGQNNPLTEGCSAQQSTKVEEARYNWCTDQNNINSDECRAWCTKDMDGKCDNAYKTYCENHPEDTNFCGCMNLGPYEKVLQDYKDSNYALAAECNVPSCRTNPFAYMTQNQLRNKCPPQTICNQKVGGEYIGGNLHLDNVKVTCSAKSTNTVGSNTPQIPPLTFVLITVAVLVIGIIAIFILR